MVSIKGLDKGLVLYKLWEGSHEQGMSSLGVFTRNLTVNDCRKALAKNKYIDYFNGRVIKVDFSRDEIDERLYDRDCGDGAAAAIISQLYPKEKHISGKKKAMISQPMAGLSDEKIAADRERAIKILEEKGYEVINTLFTDEWYSKESMKNRGVVQIPLCFLARSLENMSLCHVAYFVEGWRNARGCRIEHDAAVAYGLEIIEE